MGGGTCYNGGWLPPGMAPPQSPAPAPAPAPTPRAATSYHTYAETLAELDQVVANYPQIARKFVAGKSYQGRDIVGVPQRPTGVRSDHRIQPRKRRPGEEPPSRGHVTRSVDR